jgi:hypothetical protein
MIPNALATALGELAENYLNEPRLCCLCQWHSAVSAPIFLPDAQEDSVIRGAVLPLCGVCMCEPDLPNRIEQALRMGTAQERAAWD